jgi:hypothetical protein
LVHGSGGGDAGGGDAGSGEALEPAPAPAEGSPGEAVEPSANARPGGGLVRLVAFQEEDSAPAAEAPAEGEAPADAAPAEDAEDAAPAAQPAEAEELAAPAPAGGGADAASIDAAAAKLPPSGVITNATMAAKAKELSALLAQADAKRKSAVDLLTSAVGNYDSAIGDAQKLRQEIQRMRTEAGGGAQLPQNNAWRAMEEMFSPARLNLHKANALHLLAIVRRDEAANLAARARMLNTVKPALGDAGIDLPPTLDAPKVDADLQVATAAANEAYDVALKTLQTDVIEAAGGSDLEAASRDAAQVALVVAQFGRAQLAAAVNDEQGAKKLMDAARQTVTSGPMPGRAVPAVRARLARPRTTRPPRPRPAPRRPARPPRPPAAGTPAAALPGATPPPDEGRRPRGDARARNAAGRGARRRVTSVVHPTSASCKAPGSDVPGLLPLIGIASQAAGADHVRRRCVPRIRR